MQAMAKCPASGSSHLVQCPLSSLFPLITPITTAANPFMTVKYHGGPKKSGKATVRLITFGGEGIAYHDTEANK